MEREKTENKKSFSREIAEKEARKLKAKKEKPSVWSGLSLFGMIGWSVSVPALMGAALGMWLDKKIPQDFSWTLSLLVAGLMAGCVIAWTWISRESKEINDKHGSNDG